MGAGFSNSDLESAFLQALADREQAIQELNYADPADPELIDAAIYRIQAADSKISYLKRYFREGRVTEEAIDRAVEEGILEDIERSMEYDF